MAVQGDDGRADKRVRAVNPIAGLRRIADVIDRLTGLIGRGVAWLTLAMVLVTFLVVALRYLFDSGYIWMQESVVWMHALVFLLAAAYTLREDEHVRVDIFYRKFTGRTRAWIDLLGTILLLMPGMLFVFITSLDFVAQSWRVHETSAEAGGLPALYLLKTAIPVAALLLMLQGLAVALRSLAKIMQAGAADAQTRHGEGGKV